MEPVAPSRREFIRLTGLLGIGLGLAVHLPACAPEAPTTDAVTTLAPDAWVRVGADDIVTVLVNKSEMGQGVATGLTTILAEELDADLDRVKFAFASADPQYIDPAFGTMITGGSTSVRDMWMLLRAAGASARAMLVAAAAQQWSVDPASCTTSRGSVFHVPTNRSATYGCLAAAAAQLPIPLKVNLTIADRLTLVGCPRRRLDPYLESQRFGEVWNRRGRPRHAVRSRARCPVLGGRVPRPPTLIPLRRRRS